MEKQQGVYLALTLGLLIGVSVCYLPLIFYIVIMALIIFYNLKFSSMYKGICPEGATLLTALIIGNIILAFLKVSETYFLDYGRYGFVFRTIRIAILILSLLYCVISTYRYEKRISKEEGVIN